MGHFASAGQPAASHFRGRSQRQVIDCREIDPFFDTEKSTDDRPKMQNWRVRKKIAA